MKAVDVFLFVHINLSIISAKRTTCHRRFFAVKATNRGKILCLGPQVTTLILTMALIPDERIKFNFGFWIIG